MYCGVVYTYQQLTALFPDAILHTRHSIVPIDWELKNILNSIAFTVLSLRFAVFFVNPDIELPMASNRVFAR